MNQDIWNNNQEYTQSRKINITSLFSQMREINDRVFFKNEKVFKAQLSQ